MDVILYSVPHTGTRFAVAYLEQLGVSCKQMHTSERTDKDLLCKEGSKLVIPVRDPLLTYLSWMGRTNWINRAAPRAVPDPLLTLETVCDCYERMLDKEKTFDHTHMRLDTKTRVAELKKIAKFVGKEYQPYEWEPLGVNGDKPTDYARWEKQTDRWEDRLIDVHPKMIHHWPKHSIIDKILKCLKPYRDYYGYVN